MRVMVAQKVHQKVPTIQAAKTQVVEAGINRSMEVLTNMPTVPEETVAIVVTEPVGETKEIEVAMVDTEVMVTANPVLPVRRKAQTQEKVARTEGPKERAKGAKALAKDPALISGKDLLVEVVKVLAVAVVLDLSVLTALEAAVQIADAVAPMVQVALLVEPQSEN